MSESKEKQRGSFGNEIYGVIWPPYVNQQALDALRDYDIRDDDVMIATFPKAETHWVGEIVSLIHVNGNAEDTNRDQTCSPLEFGNIRETDSDGKQQPPGYIKAQSWKSPRVLVTHVLEEFLPKQLKEGKGKERNGLKFGDWDSFINKFIEGKAVYGPVYRHVKQFWERHKSAKNVLFLYYEDLKKDHKSGVVQIANFLGHPLSEEAIDKIVECSSFKGMSRTHHTVNGFSQQNGSSDSAESSQKRIGAVGLIRKGIVGDWKNRFTVRQNEMFDNVYKTELEGSGLTFKYE